MNNEPHPLSADQRWFNSLIGADTKALESGLADDFILINVMDGSEIGKASLLAAIGSGQLRFESIEPADRRVRQYNGTAVVTGRTKMSGSFGETPFAANSRYTHVYVERQGQWLLVSAQGTPTATPK